MKIKPIAVNGLKITNVERLDPVTLVTEDLGNNAGRAIITCFDKAWVAAWGAMGTDSTAEFILSCNEHYLANKFSNESATVNDYDKISDDIGENVDRETLTLYLDDVRDQYGNDWHENLPTTSNHEYEYICRIITAIQQALKTTQAEAA